jgi:hypothetical protein
MSFKGGKMGMATIQVTPAGGFTGTVTLSCPAAAFALAGYTCSFSPAQVNVTDTSAQSATLTVTPKATSAAAVQSGIPGATFWVVAGLWWVALGLGVYAYGGRELLGATTLRSRRACVNSWAWARGSAALAASLMVGCGGGGGGGGGNITPPEPTTTAIAVQQAGNQWNVIVTVHSSGATPAGMVSLIVDGGVSLASGVSAGQANFSFSPSPMVGIHTLDAHYAGDAKNEASDSGVQTEVFAGNATVVVAGASGSSTELVPLHISIN